MTSLTNTPFTYDGSEEFVPYPPYLCKATAKEPDKIGHTHPCRRHVDHEGDHKCICGKSWERVE